MEGLREIMESGDIDAKDGEAEAEKRGIKERTLARAKQKLGVTSVKDRFGKDGRWIWKYK